MSSEENLIENIKNKSLDELKQYFIDNFISSEKYNNFQETLRFLIKNKASLPIIKYIFEQSRVKNGDVLLFYSIQYDHFEIAKFLLGSGTKLDCQNEYENKYVNANNSNLSRIRKENILEYLIREDLLDMKKLTFILNGQKDATLLSSEILGYLILKKNHDLLEKILHFPYHNNSFVIEMIILGRQRTSSFDAKALTDYINKNNKSLLDLNGKLENVFYNPVFRKYDKKLQISDGSSPFLIAARLNDCETVKLLLDYANANGILVEINEVNEEANYPLLWAAYNNNFEMFTLMVDYANSKNTVLNIDDSNDYNLFPLLMAAYRNNTEMFKFIVEYADRNSITLDINKYDDEGQTVLSCAVKNNNTEIVKSIMAYASHKHIKLRINDCDMEGYCFLKAIEHNNTEIFKLLIDYALSNDIIFKIDYWDREEFNSLYKAVKDDNIEIVQLLMKYAIHHHLMLDVNYSDDEEGDYPILLAIKKNNTEMVKLLLEYASTNNIPLNLNQKDSKKKNYPVLVAVTHNNSEIVELLINYARKNDIILGMQDKNENGNTPMSLADQLDKKDMLSLLKNYSSSLNEKKRKIEVFEQ